jgi:hypothetical protein
MKFKEFIKRAGKKIIENKLGVTIGGSAIAVGAAGIVEPEVLEMIPENLRGYAVLLVVGTLCFRSLSAEIIDIVRAIKEDSPPAA